MFSVDVHCLQVCELTAHIASVKLDVSVLQLPKTLTDNDNDKNIFN